MTDGGAMDAFPATTRFLEGEVADGLFTRGTQVVLEQGGETVLALALGDDGRGTPVHHDTVFRVYCTIKPVTALAIARLVDDGTLDLDGPLAARLPQFRALEDGEVTLRHVLDHTAGLHRPMAIELELMPPDRRPGHLEQVARPSGWQVGAQAGYSEWFGWHVLGRLLEVTTGEELRGHLRRSVIEPLGLTDTWVGMTEDEYRATVARIGVNHDMRLLQAYPLLLERGVRMCTEVNPAHGGYSTARDLARLYGSILERLDGGGPAALPSAATLHGFTSTSRPTTYDRVLDRECAYGLGFMTELEGHAFGPSPSASAFGHSGNVGSSFAWADPAHDLAAAVVYNGVVDPESALQRRPALVRAVYADLAAASEPPPDASIEPAGAHTDEPGGRLRDRFRRRR
ncbi:serine hydrolase domain-containing protein [soil metagenome]